MKLFTNHPTSMDFDSAESFQAVQTLEYVSHVLDLTINFTYFVIFLVKISQGSSTILEDVHDNPIKDLNQNPERFNSLLSTLINKFM